MPIHQPANSRPLPLGRSRHTRPNSSERTSSRPAATSAAPGHRTAGTSKAIPGATRNPPPSSGSASCSRRGCRISLRSITGKRWKEAPVTANGSTPNATRCVASSGSRASGSRSASRDEAASKAIAAATQPANATATYPASKPKVIGPPTARPFTSGSDFVPGRPCRGPLSRVPVTLANVA